jgi:hypothetical protein
MNKSKKVNFSVEKIRPITRKNRITGTQDDSDSDSDIGSDYEKPFSPPPSPSPSYNPNESPIKPSIALLQKKASDFALRQIEKETYHPMVVSYDSRNPNNGYYYPEYNDKFNQYLKQRDITLNNSTSIADLEHALINMFEDEFKKKVTACDFIRDVVFNKDKLLGDYSTYIQEWGSGSGGRNYFYINVMLKDMTSDSDSQDSTDTVILGNNNIEKEMIEEAEHTDDPHDGGSRKRKKTNKKKTNKRKKTNKKKTNKKKTNKKKTNKKKTNKKKNK